jgi:hypothetical protein
MMKMKGSWNRLAAICAIWGNFSYALSALVFAGFAKTGSWSFPCIHAYAFPAFLVHMPVMTLVGILTDDWRAGPLRKAMVVSTASVVGSWIIGAVLSHV